jgi:PAS domain S-box-containing protein
MSKSDDTQELTKQIQLLEHKNAELKQRIRVLSKDNRDQSSLIRSLLEYTPFGIILFDINRNAIRINREAEHILNITRNTTIGKNCSKIFSCYESNNGCPILDQNRQLDREETQCCIDERMTQTLLRSTMSSTHHNETIIIEAFIDISEIKAAQEATIAANQAKDDFIAKMSHELRTPLNAVIGFSELMIEDLESNGDDMAIGTIEKISRAGNDMLHLIEDILDFSQIQANKLQLEISTGKISQLLDILNNTMEPLLQARGNTLSFHCDEEELLIETDIFRLRQVLLNLINNANKFTDQGNIIVNVSRINDDGVNMIQFRVSDTGIGMSEEESHRIFEPFEQADNSSTRRYSGIGLGLTISKELCHHLHGKLSVKSQPGKGTDFCLTIPEKYY